MRLTSDENESGNALWCEIPNNILADSRSNHHDCKVYHRVGRNNHRVMHVQRKSVPNNVSQNLLASAKAMQTLCKSVSHDMRPVSLFDPTPHSMQHTWIADQSWQLMNFDFLNWQVLKYV